MKAPNLIWSGLFFVLVVGLEWLFGTKAVGGTGAGIVSVLAVIVKLWQEYQVRPGPPMTGIRSVRVSGLGYWRRVLTQ